MSFTILEQIRTVDKRRLTTYIGRLRKEHISGLDHALAVSIDLIEPIHSKLTLYFTTDRAGTILVSDIMPGTTLVVKETRTKPGYVLDEVPQTIKIESNETKTLEFRNQPLGSLLIRKVCAVNPSVTLSNAEFKVAYSDGTLIGDSNGVYRSDER